MPQQIKTPSSPLNLVRRNLPLVHDDQYSPLGLQWRSNTFFIVCTVGIGVFTDMFLYGLIVPVLPFMLEDRVAIPNDQVQSTISNLLAIYAAASMAASPVAGVLADTMTSSRQLPFLLGLLLLLASTVLLAVGRSVGVLMLARFLQGASGGTVWTIGLALLTETVGQKNLGKTIGMIFSFVSVAGLFSPIVGGVLYAKTGYTGVFGVGVGLVAVDFLMRLVMIEKKVAAKYLPSETSSPTSTPGGEESSSANESTPLLPETSALALDGSSPGQSPYHLPDPKNRILKRLPILLVLRDPALLTALFMGFIQAHLLGAFDATVPLVAATRYDFDSLRDGLLFLPLGCADFFLGPIFGWVVDRWGTKPVSVLGFLYLVPALVLLRLPVETPSDGEMSHQIALYAVLLGINGMGLAIINSPSIVECSVVMEKYTAANPQLFEQPPYAQLYGLTSMTWSLGLTVGPLVSGRLKERIGYGNMNAVLASICGLTAILAWCFVGGKGTGSDGDGEDEEQS